MTFDRMSGSRLNAAEMMLKNCRAGKMISGERSCPVSEYVMNVTSG